MADEEEQQFSTLAERIAALNKQKNFGSPSMSSPAQPVQGRRPPPPSPPAAAHRPGQSASLAAPAPTENSRDVSGPPLPTRRSPSQTARAPAAQLLGPPPSLPPRRPSGPFSATRRPSSESIISSGSATSMSVRTLSRVSSNTSQSSGGDGLRRMAPAFGTTKLPPLPPSKREREAAEQEAARQKVMERAEQQEAERKEKQEAVSSARNSVLVARTPPALPSRPAAGHASVSAPHLPRSRGGNEPGNGNGSPPALPTRRPTVKTEDAPAPVLPKRRPPAKSILEMGLSSGRPALPRRPSATPAVQNYDDADDDSPPPPLPVNRPSQAQIQAAFRGAAGGPSARRAPAADDECLLCRDFSAPDEVAARYPISVLPRQNTVAYLAQQLCGGFPSTTDKARAIFAWCHHNIAYDVDGFFGGCIPQGQSVSESIFSGKAVCEGYARIYEAVARAAGLECRVVGGHGKGYGFTQVLPGQPVPRPNPSGHAWNAVRIDGGEWKLLDACWGAGNVSETRAQRYEKKFDPSMFTMSNEEFGERHFPQDPSCFFRADGRVLSWAEYVVEKSADPPVTVYGFASEQFIAPQSVEPSRLSIQSLQSGGRDDVVHFRFGRACSHWKLHKHGHGLQPYLMQIGVHGGGHDGQSDEMVTVHYEAPMQWRADIPRRKLGRPGDTITCMALTQLNDRDMRGATLAEFEAPMRSRRMAMSGVCMWKLV